ncbi:ATP-binding protein [Bradyrhizobium sp. 41S5]|uniref:AAA family ATPase n=1 Tax=Bradyrhizobium sp. 41S5 TaxID=1404443 RepID=UPI001594FA91|nr:AAA family ATPase [Bradyrhizobium sp. 41S5]UFX41922.1 ATP-binding protein [Bradyrhizobium sp. 41S5]
MRLKSFRVKEFQSVRDSGLIEVDDIACLVGKNEAGKSALLKALYRLNPVIPSESKFSVTIDYPRMDVEDYRHAVEAKKRQRAMPIWAQFALEEKEVAGIEAMFGPECLIEKTMALYKCYEDDRYFSLKVNEEKALRFLFSSADIPELTREAVAGAGLKAADVVAALNAQEQTAEIKRLVGIMTAIAKDSLIRFIYDQFLAAALPKFLYFDEYYQLSGHENIQALIERSNANGLKPSDHPMLGLIRLARLSLKEMVEAKSTIDLKGKLEGASNYLSKQILKYWSQNKHLRMTFDVRPGLPDDPPGMQSGFNIWGGVFDSRHLVTTELGSRSRGFVWFFSFLAWYSDVKRNGDKVILLLDEPGLTLHAKAQEDLLRYFETELRGEHQLVYSTHSPFMIDPRHFERVRIVQDLSIENDGDQEEETSAAGTTVLPDVFAASDDSLFPLQGALGYEIHQTLFVSPYSIVVEGAADLLFMQAISGILESSGRTGLDSRWTITPVGGASKVPTFVALLGAQRGMKIVTLLDTQKADQASIEAIYKEKLLKKSNVLTFADFIDGASEADVEDMFGLSFYLQLVNAEFAKQLSAPIKPAGIKSKHPRILKRIEDYLESHPLSSGKFGHFRPARYFAENVSSLTSSAPKEALDRFEKAFGAINRLID